MGKRYGKERSVRLRSGGGGVPEDDKGGRRGEKRDNKGN